MSGWRRRTTGGILGLLLLAPLAACGAAGDVSITNNSTDEVTVQIEGDETTISRDGGVELLDVGCLKDDIQVRYSSTGKTVVLPGPVCPDQAIVINDKTVSLLQATAED